MSADVAWPEPHPVIRTMGRADRACRVCGWRFFTLAGRDDHECECRPPPPPTPLQQAGLRRAEANNTYSRRCDGCGRLSTPAGLGKHQHGTGHTGWTVAG